MTPVLPSRVQSARPPCRPGTDHAAIRSAIARPRRGLHGNQPETGTTTQGVKTLEEALANLREATELYLAEFPLEACGKALLTTIEVSPRAA